MLTLKRTTGTLLLLLATVAPASAQDKATPAPANAKREPSAGDLATARAALREGLSLRERGDVQPALGRLATAYDLVPTPVTAFELGKTHLMLGNVLQAHELFKKVVRMPASLEESTRSQTSRDEAARLAKEIEPRIPSLRIKLQLPPGATAVVTVDDAPITTTGPETVRAVDPGPHDVVAKAGDGPEQKVHVEVPESDIQDVVLSPQWIPPKVTKTGPGEAPPIFVRSTNPLVFIGFGVGAAAAVMTGITAYVAATARDDARDLCGERFCPPRTDRDGAAGEANFTREASAAEGWPAAAVVCGLASALFLSVGLIGLRRPIKERVISAVQPVVGPTNVGMVGTF